jgi:hypothetical protein
MTAQEFCEAALDLHDQAARLPGAQALSLKKDIVEALVFSTPYVDERIVRLHRQLKLVELTHSLMRLECHSRMSAS